MTGKFFRRDPVDDLAIDTFRLPSVCFDPDWEITHRAECLTNRNKGRNPVAAIAPDYIRAGG